MIRGHVVASTRHRRSGWTAPAGSRTWATSATGLVSNLTTSWSGKVTTGYGRSCDCRAGGGKPPQRLVRRCAAVRFISFEWLRGLSSGRLVAVPRICRFRFHARVGGVSIFGLRAGRPIGGSGPSPPGATPYATLRSADLAPAFDQSRPITYLMALVAVGDEDGRPPLVRFARRGPRPGFRPVGDGLAAGSPTGQGSTGRL